MRYYLIDMYQRVFAFAVLLLSLPLVSFAQTEFTESLQTILISLTYFLQYVIVPLLFAIALLVFLVNVVRYFIIGGGNTDEQEKAKRLAFYSIAAFVFLVSLWGIVNMFVTGLGFANERSLCPDYLKNWCGNIHYNIGERGPDPLRPMPRPDGTSAPVTTRPPVSTTPTGTAGDSDEDPEPLAELVFGDGRDMVSFSFNTAAPRAVSSTVSIPTTASCRDGFYTLAEASRLENSQAAYALYKNSDGVVRWQNVSDDAGRNRIQFDGDVLRTLNEAPMTSIHLVHTHTKRRADTVELTNLNGHGPSAGDLTALCNSVDNDMPHLIVDWGNNVWRITQNAGACTARTEAEKALFPVIETKLALAMVPNTERKRELNRYLNSDLVSSAYRSAMQPLSNLDLESYSQEQMLALASADIAKARLSIQLTDERAFCGIF